MQRIQVRDAQVGDAEIIADLMTQINFPNTKEDIERRLTDLLSREDYHALIAEKDGKPIGMIGIFLGRFFERDQLFGRILALAVDKEYRYKGAGAVLIAEGEKWLKARGASYMVINSSSDRTSAHGFYKVQGYEKAGVRFIKTL